eukprot:284818621_2
MTNWDINCPITYFAARTKHYAKYGRVESQFYRDIFPISRQVCFIPTEDVDQVPLRRLLSKAIAGLAKLPQPPRPQNPATRYCGGQLLELQLFVFATTLSKPRITSLCYAGAPFFANTLNYRYRSLLAPVYRRETSSGGCGNVEMSLVASSLTPGIWLRNTPRRLVLARDHPTDLLDFAKQLSHFLAKNATKKRRFRHVYIISICPGLCSVSELRSQIGTLISRNRTGIDRITSSHLLSLRIISCCITKKQPLRWRPPSMPKHILFDGTLEKTITEKRTPLNNGKTACLNFTFILNNRFLQCLLAIWYESSLEEAVYNSIHSLVLNQVAIERQKQVAAVYHRLLGEASGARNCVQPPQVRPAWLSTQHSVHIQRGNFLNALIMRLKVPAVRLVLLVLRTYLSE